jgi:hypothetical protein
MYQLTHAEETMVEEMRVRMEQNEKEEKAKIGCVSSSYL